MQVQFTEAAFVVYAISFSFRNQSSSLYKERNGQLLQDVWIVTWQPATVTVLLRTHFHHDLSHPLFMVPSPTWTYIIDQPPIFHPPFSHFARSDHNCDLRQIRSDVWNAISTAFLIVFSACAQDSDLSKVSDVPNPCSQGSLTGTGLRILLYTK